MRTKGCQRANLAYRSSPATCLRSWLRATFDTGADTSIVSLAAAARAGLRPDMPGARPGGFQHGFGRQAIATWIVPVELIRIGDEQIRNARVRIGDIGMVADMLIGADFFISHRVFVSNALHKLYFSCAGGPIFDLTAHWAGDGDPSARPGAAATPGPPLDAAALGRRGAVEAAQHDAARALADLSQAIALASAEPRYLLRRASI